MPRDRLSKDNWARQERPTALFNPPDFGVKIVANCVVRRSANLNPKPAVFYLAFLPQFIHADDPALLKSMFLATIQFVIGILWLMLLSVCVVKLSRALGNISVRRAIDTVTGSVMLAFGLGLLFDNKR